MAPKIDALLKYPDARIYGFWGLNSTAGVHSTSLLLDPKVGIISPRRPLNISAFYVPVGGLFFGHDWIDPRTETNPFGDYSRISLMVRGTSNNTYSPDYIYRHGSCQPLEVRWFVRHALRRSGLANSPILTHLDVPMGLLFPPGVYYLRHSVGVVDWNLPHLAEGPPIPPPARRCYDSDQVPSRPLARLKCRNCLSPWRKDNLGIRCGYQTPRSLHHQGTRRRKDSGGGPRRKPRLLPMGRTLRMD